MLNYMLKHRNPGWVELFFDLAFVVFLGRIAHLLFHTHDNLILTTDFFAFIWMVNIQFLVWMLFTVYMNFYGDDSIFQSRCAFLLMLFIIYNAMLTENTFENAKYIVSSLGVMSLIISLMYRKSQRQLKENETYARYKSNALFLLFLLSLIVWFLSPTQALWFAIILFVLEHVADHFVPLARPDTEHFVERIGIFVILILGESLMTIVNQVPSDLTLTAIYPVIILLICFFAIFVNYFTFIETLAHLKYERYEHILMTNWFILTALTVFPAVIYHGINQGIEIWQFECLTVYFVVLFFLGMGLTYARVPQKHIAYTVTYMIVPIVGCVVSLILTHSYVWTLVTLLLVCALTSTYLLCLTTKFGDE